MALSDMSSMKVLVGICAYNEEYNIKRLLKALTEQNLPSNSRIMVMCSGCTDRTPQIVEEFCKRDSRIEIVVEKFRKGKANALNRIFREAKTSADFLVLINADALPRDGDVKTLVSCLRERQVGAVFARPVPVNEIKSVSNKISHIVWKLHHKISSYKAPKLSGELCAIRADCLEDIPESIATDEPFIELFIRRQGYRILYIPEALVYIRCPTNIIDLFRQRKRIWIGHLQIRKMTGFVVSTSSLRNTLWTISTLKLLEIPYALMGATLEGLAFLVARRSFNKGKVPHIWEPIKSTKTSL